MIDHDEWSKLTPEERAAENIRIMFELKCTPLVLVIPPGLPGPDGMKRLYPLFTDSYDVIYESKVPLNTLAKIAKHYNSTADEEFNSSRRVRVVEDHLEFYGEELLTFVK